MSSAIDHFAPFHGFYADAKTSPPATTAIAGATMPEPYRSLLVNDGDMTPTLEKFHRCKLHLKLLGRVHVGDEYRRQVLLLDPQDRPTEFGGTIVCPESVTPEPAASVSLKATVFLIVISQLRPTVAPGRAAMMAAAGAAGYG